jgi:hypothetical protein
VGLGEIVVDMANSATGGERTGTGSDIAVRGISADLGEEEKT